MPKPGHTYITLALGTSQTLLERTILSINQAKYSAMFPSTINVSELPEQVIQTCILRHIR